MGRLIDADALREQISKDPRETFTKHQVWLFASEHNKTVPTVEAIPKADYENCLKSDLEAILEELDLEVDELASHFADGRIVYRYQLHKLIRQKIETLKGEETDGKREDL